MVIFVSFKCCFRSPYYLLTWNLGLSPLRVCLQGPPLFLRAGDRPHVVASRSQCLRDLPRQVGIAAVFICEGVENAELPWSKLDRIPFQAPFFIQRELLS